VIPTYNRARDLARAIASVREQTFRDWEVIIVDNHSTDGTVALVAELGDPRIAVHQVHNGGVIAISRNVGIQRARGEYVAFLDSDDWWAPEKLERSVAALEAGADVVYHDLYAVTTSSPRLLRKRASTRLLRPPVFDDLLTRGNALNNSSVIVRAACLEAIGGLSEDPDLIAGEDFDTWLRIAGMTDRFVRLADPLGYYWVGGGAISNPRRTLTVLAALEARYGEALRARGGPVAAPWLSYSRGKAHFRLGQYREAWVCLQSALSSHGRLDWTRRGKALWMLGWSRLRARW
jgi:glycosyltransferase involved in cell wall biosynthesis